MSNPAIGYAMKLRNLQETLVSLYTKTIYQHLSYMGV